MAQPLLKIPNSELEVTSPHSVIKVRSNMVIFEKLCSDEKKNLPISAFKSFRTYTSHQQPNGPCTRFALPINFSLQYHFRHSTQHSLSRLMVRCVCVCALTMYNGDFSIQRSVERVISSVCIFDRHRLHALVSVVRHERGWLGWLECSHRLVLQARRMFRLSVALMVKRRSESSVSLM